MSKFVLKLYITGQTPRSERAVANLRRVCERLIADGYDLTIVDVLDRPELAEAEKILATPTLVKESPPPMRRVIGDLSSIEQVLSVLDLPLYSSARSSKGDE